jgi:peptidoglycan/xylan/chitin deacetylase (PgdA/CDA1 family)
VAAMIIGLSGYTLLSLHNKLLVTNPLYKAPIIEDKEYTKPAVRTVIVPQVPIASVSAQLRIPIIMYHYVEYVRDPADTIRKSLAIIPAEFERQLLYLKDHGYSTLLVKDVPFYLQNPQLLPSKPIILTFDDGYKDFYTDAFPLLKQYDMKATIYVINDFIGNKDFLDKDEIQTLIDSNLIELGAHTLDHLNLKYAHDDLARRQISDSKKGLEEMFHTHIFTFAYPYGGFTLETEELVKEASYSAALTVDPGVDHTEDSLFHLTRIRAGSIVGQANQERILP